MYEPNLIRARSEVSGPVAKILRYVANYYADPWIDELLGRALRGASEKSPKTIAWIRRYMGSYSDSWILRASYKHS